MCRSSTRIARLVIAFTALLFSKSAFAFGPCDGTFPRGVSYEPALAECGGKAAIILSGKFLNSFSVVARACDNGDRDPCYKNDDSCGTNSSSPFKMQKTIEAVIQGSDSSVPAKIHCLKEAGDSKVFKMVRRITIKRRDPVLNPATDVFRLCLPSRTVARRPVTILSVGREKPATNFGYTPSCATQKYLGCNLDKAIERICPAH